MFSMISPQGLGKQHYECLKLTFIWIYRATYVIERGKRGQNNTDKEQETGRERKRERELTLLNEVVLFKGVIFTLVSGCAQRVSPAEWTLCVMCVKGSDREGTYSARLACEHSSSPLKSVYCIGAMLSTLECQSVTPLTPGM